MRYFDVVIVGAGHAGIEAGVVAAKMGCSVGLVTMDKNAIGRMSCNPAIGGSAKGHLVHEIDALGGAQGIIADKSGIQFRTLNKSKGPAVWAGRAQSDRALYSVEAAKLVNSVKSLEIVEDSVMYAHKENGKITCCTTEKGVEIKCKALIISSGTFLNGLMHTGMKATKGGRFGEKAAVGLTESFLNMGFKTGRLKTGTPPRLAKDSIDFDALIEQPGDENPKPFSLRTDRSEFPYLPQVSCYLAYTNGDVHKSLEKGFEQSPLFQGLINGAGPRYCPSIEDKIVRFSDKPKHQLFLEPEGLDNDQMYLNGFSTSLPEEVQFEALRKIPGLENVEMIRPGYAVEYDFFPPYQVDLTLETKLVEGLYFAGQINGTSGYEEAAGQGLIAGINAALKIQDRGELILKRSQAYIGVLIDDLVGKSTYEPYRMFTSRAEHRLVLRQDNADRRLMRLGYEIGLIPKNIFQEMEEREKLIEESRKLFNSLKIKPEKVNPLLEQIGSTPIQSSENFDKLTKRPNLRLRDMLELVDSKKYPLVDVLKNSNGLLEKVEIEMKYEGYIKRQMELIEKMEKLEDVEIPENFNYQKLNSISTEGREKLSKIKPRSIGQASRISGVSPSDISVLLVYLRN